jgi:proteasome accessory factor C
MDKTSRKLRTILTLIPYVQRHQGVSADNICEHFKIDRVDLDKMLETIFICGLPPYGPGDLIDAFIDDDRVYIESASRLNRPIGFNRLEAFAIRLGLDIFSSLYGDNEILQKIKGKIDRIILFDADNLESLARSFAIEPVSKFSPDIFNTLTTAIKQKQKLRIKYYTYGRDSVSERTIHPYGIIFSVLHGYLVAFCESQDDERMFRLDRIKSMKTVREGFVTPQDFDLTRFQDILRHQVSEKTPNVRIECSERVAATFRRRWEMSLVKKLKSGRYHVDFYSGKDHWTLRFLARFGADAEILEPAKLRESMHGFLSSARRNYN